MLGEIFYWIFNMSIAAAICGIPIVLIRFIKRIPRRVFVWLWLIPFVRLCLPVGISGEYGLMHLISKFTTKTVTVWAPREDLSFTMMNHFMGAESYFPITYKVDVLETLFSVASVIWAIVAAAIVLAFFTIYFATLKELGDAKKLKDNVYVSDKIKTPAVYGIIKPRIIIPGGYKEKDIEYIILHERAHIRRKDNLVRVIALMAVCLHWFNPVAWLFLKLLYSDIELACDESVLSKSDAGQRKEYAHALVSSVEKTNVFASPFGGAKIRLRIENILSYKKMSVLSLTGFVALLVSIAYILLTNA